MKSFQKNIYDMWTNKNFGIRTLSEMQQLQRKLADSTFLLNSPISNFQFSKKQNARFCKLRHTQQWFK